MGGLGGLATDDGRLVIVAGASRSGKTAWTARQVRKLPRVLVWDAECQWAVLPGFRKVSGRRELIRAVQGAGPARLAFVPGPDLRGDFDVWSAAARYWGTYCGPCVVVAEELADVSTPAKAPAEWGMLVRRGLKRGISIYAISQRWAEADKTAVGNASEFVLFRMSSGDDIAYMARKTRVPAAELESLAPLQYVRFSVTGDIERGRLTFR